MNELQQTIEDLQLIMDSSEPANEFDTAADRLNSFVLKDIESAKQVFEQLEVDAMLYAHFENLPPATLGLSHPVVEATRPNRTRLIKIFLTIAACLLVLVGGTWIVIDQSKRTPIAQSRGDLTDKGSLTDKGNLTDGKDKKTDSLGKSKGTRSLHDSEIKQGKSDVSKVTIDLSFGSFKTKSKETISIQTPLGSIYSEAGDFEVELLPKNATKSEDIERIIVKVRTGTVELQTDVGKIKITEGETATASRQTKPKLINIGAEK